MGVCSKEGKCRKSDAGVVVGEQDRGRATVTMSSMRGKRRDGERTIGHCVDCPDCRLPLQVSPFFPFKRSCATSSQLQEKA